MSSHFALVQNSGKEQTPRDVENSLHCDHRESNIHFRLSVGDTGGNSALEAVHVAWVAGHLVLVLNLALPDRATLLQGTTHTLLGRRCWL